MQKTLQTLLDLYIKSSVHVALAVVAFTGVTMLTFEFERNPGLLLFIFFGTVTGYNFVKYFQIAKLQHRGLTKNLRIIQIFSLGCFIALVYFTLKQPVPVLVVSAICGLLTILYTLPVFREKKNLRSFSGIKIFIIALVWAGITVLLPVLDAGIIYLYDTIIPFIQRCLFVMVLTLPFDIRDLSNDVPQLGTIPQQFGIRKTRTIGTILLSLIILLEILKPVIDITEVLSLLIIVIFTYFLVRNSVKRQSSYFASFWVEGIPILWWAILWSAEYFW